MTDAALIDWPRLRALALGLGLPHVEESVSWGQPNLKAFGKMWVWWSPHEDAPVFKLPKEDRALLLEHEPERFFVTDHYRPQALVLMRPERFDADWALANWRRVWRDQAPKRFLKQWDATHPSPEGPAT